MNQQATPFEAEAKSPPNSTSDSSIDWHRRGLELFHRGALAPAVQALELALKYSASALTWNDYGVCLLTQCRFPEADAAFQRALQMDPNCKRAAENLAAQRKLLSAGAITRFETPVAPVLPVEERGTLSRRIRDIIERFFANPPSSDVAASAKPSIVDAKSGWMDVLLGRGEVHDQDYLVFGSFRDPESTILDIGAHYGYSAVSIWASGATVGVVSFEANRLFEPCLRRLTELRPGRYDYRIGALGESEGRLRFAMPVVNGHDVGALTSACATPNIDCLTRNVLDHWDTNYPGQPLHSFEMHSFEVPVARLDAVLDRGGFAVNPSNIVAVKVDTESFEAEVLAGGRELLGRQKPLLLIESGHQTPRVRALMCGLGYAYARRSELQLEIASGPVGAVGGFFLHPDRAAEYRRIGLLQG